ncbi:MAG: hypothetical protein RR404_04480 [Bacilli bacterium]
MESLFGFLAGFLLLFLVFAIIIYVVFAIFLNKLNKLMYNKKTPMAWIPIFNIYLLGKLAVNKLVGWILVICVFLTSTSTTTVNGVKTESGILPSGIRSVVSTVYLIAVIALFIYAIIKYYKLKKNKNGVKEGNVIETNQPTQTPTMPTQTPSMPTQTPITPAQVVSKEMPQEIISTSTPLGTDINRTVENKDSNIDIVQDEIL